MTSSVPGLAALRRQVDRSDREIASAIRRRLELATAIGATKARSAAPVRDFARERTVLARWRSRLAPAGIPPARSDALARWLIEESLRVQETGPRTVRRSRGVGRRVAIIGGAGRMGQWLDHFLSDAGHDVRVVDPRATEAAGRTLPTVEAAMRECEIVAFATPVRSTAPLLAAALEIPSEAVVFDLLSVKAPIQELLQSASVRGRLVTSVHPMFGPSARTLSGRNLLLLSCGVPTADQVVRELFAGSALTISEFPVAHHDRLIAESLGLAHAVNLLFLASLAQDPIAPPDLAAAASTTFHRQSSLAASVAQEGPELYLDIQSLNPHTGETYDELRMGLERLAAIVARRDLPAFRALLDAGRSKLEPGSEPMRA